MLDLICLGNITIDDLVLPDGSVHIGCFGGDAVYAALSAKLWTDSVGLVAPLGYDCPSTYVNRLKDVGFDLSGLPYRNVPTYRNWVVYDHSGHRTWIPQTADHHFFELSPLTADIPEDYRNARGFLVLAMDLAAQEDLIGELSKANGLVALDPQEDYIAGNEDRVISLIKQVDIFLPSEIEVERLMGHRDFERAARDFISFGCKVVVIKMGSKGALVYESSTCKEEYIPVFPVNAVDSTGAGDSFSGGFMACFVRTLDVVQSGLCGAVSASFAIEGYGTEHLFSISRSQALERFEELVKIRNYFSKA